MTSRSSPKNFKQMTFPPARSGTAAIYAPLPPAPPIRVITDVEAERRAKQLQQMKDFLNQERCPVCGSQLDGGIGYDKAAVYCVSGTVKEYAVHYIYGLNCPQWSKATYYTTQWAYQIISDYVVDGMYRNTLYKLDLSLNEKFRERDKKQLFSFEGQRLLLPQNTTEQELDDKIKLYTLFS